MTKVWLILKFEVTVIIETISFLRDHLSVLNQSETTTDYHMLEHSGSQSIFHIPPLQTQTQSVPPPKYYPKN